MKTMDLKGQLIDSSNENHEVLKETRRIQALNFYAKSNYLPPLERLNLKHNVKLLKDITESKHSVSDLSKKIKKKPHVKNKLPKKVLLPKSGITKKQVLKVKSMNVHSVPLNAILDPNKKTSESPQNRKFFKSRSTLSKEHLNVPVRFGSILPINMKAASSFCRQKNKATDKETSQELNVSFSDNLQDLETSNEKFSEHFKENSPPCIINLCSNKSVEKNNPCVAKGISPSHSINSSNSTGESIEGDSQKDCDEQANAVHEVPDKEDSSVQSESSSTGESNLYPVFYKDAGRNFQEDTLLNSSKRKITPCSVKLTKLSSKVTRTGMEQYIIVAGQNTYPKKCPTCFMMYNVGSELDERLHASFHAKYLSNLKFPGWKKENVIGLFLDGRIIKVTSGDAKMKLRKVEDVLEVVNRELGFAPSCFPSRLDSIVLLFISDKNVVAGCLIAESITSARRVMLDESSCVFNNSQTENVTQTWCAGSDLVKVLCGINVIWIAPDYRRKKMASRLVDCLRCNFLYGHAISLDELAFSDPSLNGRDFAAAYTKSNHFLVYK